VPDAVEKRSGSDKGGDGDQDPGRALIEKLHHW